MRKYSIIFAMLLISFAIPSFGQSFSSLWKQVDEAEEKDLPRTQLDVLQKIIQKATKEKAYGHLLKAELNSVSVQSSISPDSLMPAFRRLMDKEAKVRTSNPLLAAIYESALYQVLDNNYNLSQQYPGLEREYAKLSMSHPELLAKHKAAEFTPLFENGYDSRWFDDDLLSVIGYAAHDYAAMHDYYVKTPMRNAACLTALELLRQSGDSYGRRMATSNYVKQLDSLINDYGDLKVAGELALARYEFMKRASDVTVEDRINYINYALGRWGAWPRMNILRNEQKRLTRAGFDVDFGTQVSLPDRPRDIFLSDVRNVQQLTMSVARVDVQADKEYDLSKDKVYAEVAKTKSRVQEITQTRSFIGQPEYALSKDTIHLPGMKPGIYLVEFDAGRNDVKPCRFFYYVSDVFVMNQMRPDNSIRYVAVSATTGQPLPGATIVLKKNRYNGETETKTLKADANGEAIFQPDKNGDQYQTVFATTANDRFSPPQQLWTRYYFYSYDNHDRDQTSLFTDRKLYRPGQTVHVSAIVHNNKGGMRLSSVKDEEITFTLYDANHREVEQKKMTTDEYGSAAVDFTLPKNGLTGTFVIRANNGATNFHVEEYKRPTYQLEFPEVKEHYEAGDTVVVKAHAMTYAGVPVQGAKVSYTVRRVSSWWWRYGSDEGNELLRKEATTDNEGAFLIEMPMILPEWAKESDYPCFYDIVAEVMATDTGGESHEGTFRLPVGNRSTALACDLPEQVLRDSLKTITFSYKNMAGADIDGTVRYWVDGQKEAFTAKANQPVPVNWPKALLASGKHHLKAICGKDTLEQDFVFFSLSDTKPCTETHDWFYASHSQFPADGSPVTIQVGCSDKDVRAVYMITSGDKLIEQGQLTFNNSLVNKTFRYSKDYANGLLFTVAWVKEAVMYSHTATIAKPVPDMNLEMEWVTFRDRLTPGQKEEWKLKIKTPDGKPAKAQLLATLYDQSLDQILPHNWTFSPTLFLPRAEVNWDGYTFSRLSSGAQEPFKNLNEPELAYTHFNEEMMQSFFPYFRRYDRRMKSAGVFMESAPMVEEMAVMDAVVRAYAANGAMGDEKESPQAAQKKESSQPQLRENLNETAFFLPQVSTDDKGVATLAFTLPECLTTWQFMGLAHDTQMNHGLIKAQTVARKEVMVQPNVPRFVRMGDRAQIAARIFNTTEKNVSGTAKLELIDPETDKVVVSQSKNYSIDAKGSETAIFEVNADDMPALLVCRVTASGKGYSDGEQHYLPVLPNTEWVTNTMPLTFHGPTTQQIDLSQLFPQGTEHQTLTVEYTGNPAWMVLQSLPSLAADDSENAISQAAVLYSTTIGSFILDQVPHAQEVFEKWMKEAGEETTLMSQLQKNQDVKNLVLNETPWVAAAEHEAAQRQALSTFFDRQLMEQRTEAALAKLAQLQNGNGSWSWWPGMEGSIYMTQAVAEMMVRLNVLTTKQNSTSAMLNKAFRYLGDKLVEEEKDLKKWEKEGAKDLLPSEWAISTLYTFALDKREQPKEVKQAIDYMVGLLKKQPKGFTIYGKANTAVILAHFGQEKTAREFMQSLREYAVYSEENGRYYDTPKAYYSWCNYLIPTQVAAIEALQMLEPDNTKTVDEMLRWLLTQKRTEMWNTNINTVNAVYAFLNGRTKQLEVPNIVDITIDGKPMQMDEATAGIGFIKSQMPAEGLRDLTFSKRDDHTSWGAVFAQFTQQSTEVENHEAGLKVTRQVVGGTNLTVGDKVLVRITIEAERDYDFVQVTDKRAACMEPASQLSGYRNGYYCAPKDNCTNYYFSKLRKGTHVVETEYYIDRAGDYASGTCSVQCAYAPEYSARTRAYQITSK